MSTARSTGEGLLSANVGLAQVEHLMHDLCEGSSEDRVGSALREHLMSGGKRLRARLTLSAVQALGGNRLRAVPLAAASEMLHNATLIHDDLQDGDAVRRGRPAVWARYGLPQALNTGDLGLMLPIAAMGFLDVSDAYKWRLTSTLTEYAIEVVRGQSHELELLNNGDLSWAAWEAAANGKTAALFALPVHLAALFSGCAPEAARCLADAYRSIGVIFQLQDDLVDILGEKERVSGSDVLRGTVTSIVVEHLRLYPHERAWWVDLLARPRTQTSITEIDDVRNRFVRGGAVREVWQRIDQKREQIRETPAFTDWPLLRQLAMDLVSMSLTSVQHTAPADTFSGQGA